MIRKIPCSAKRIPCFRREQGIRRNALDLHALKGDLKGCWAVTVRANWRVIFRFEDGKALDVDLVDYH